MTEPPIPPPTEALIPPVDPPTDEGPGGNPWERRTALGFAKGLLDNLKLFVTNPGEGFSQTLRSGDYLSPLVFAVIVGWVGSIAAQIWSLLFGASVMEMLPPEFSDQFGTMMAGSAASTIMGIIFAPVLIAIGLFIWAGIVHLFLLLVGGGSDAGFEGTFRASSYAYVGALAQVIPVFGGMIAMVWSLVLQIIGLIHLHRTGGGRASAAALLPMVLCCVCVIIAVVVFSTAIMAAMGAAAQ